MTDNLPVLTDKDFTSKLLGKIKCLALASSEGVTGVLASDKKDIILTAGRIFQSLVSQEFFNTLHNEWDDYKAKGRIKDDYQQTEQHHACLQQMLDFLDSDKPDKIRFDFMKKIFLSAATEMIEDRDSILPQQYMSIARQMTSGDVLLLSELFEMYSKKRFDPGNNSYDYWTKTIAEGSQLAHEALVKLHEKSLIELQLIDGVVKDTMRQIIVSRAAYGRLTTLALGLSKFIRNYDKQVERKRS